MAETIVPVVHGEHRTRYWSTVALYAIAATAAAAAMGFVLGATGALAGAPWGAAGMALIALVAVLYLLREAVGLPVPIPDRRRQVPDWWRTFFSPPAAATLYGLGLGVGFLTYLRHGTLVAVAVAAIAGGDPLLGMALCAPFGLARALTVTVSRHARSAEEAAAVVDRLERGARRPARRTVNAVALGAVALAAALAIV